MQDFSEVEVNPWNHPANELLNSGSTREEQVGQNRNPIASCAFDVFEKNPFSWK